MLPLVKQRIIESFSSEALDLFEREFDFFDKVTSISGVLFPLPKEERRAGIRRYSLFKQFLMLLLYIQVLVKFDGMTLSG